MILLSFLSRDYFRTPSSIGITLLLWSYLTETCNNILGKTISVLPSIETFMHLFLLVTSHPMDDIESSHKELVFNLS